MSDIYTYGQTGGESLLVPQNPALLGASPPRQTIQPFNDPLAIMQNAITDAMKQYGGGGGTGNEPGSIGSRGDNFAGYPSGNLTPGVFASLFGPATAAVLGLASGLAKQVFGVELPAFMDPTQRGSITDAAFAKNAKDILDRMPETSLDKTGLQGNPWGGGAYGPATPAVDPQGSANAASGAAGYGGGWGGDGGGWGGGSDPSGSGNAASGPDGYGGGW